MLRQRKPRLVNDKYLAWLRQQNCACCGQAGPCDAAHLRASSLKYEKDSGWGRPDDKWALPLKHSHHMEQHHHGDELAWWASRGIRDPFKLAIEHYQRFLRSKQL